MALFKTKNESPPEPSSSSNPYLNGREEWLERYGSYISRAAQWRMVAFFCLILTGISITGNVMQANQVKTVPYIIEVDKLGKSSVVNRADSASGTKPITPMKSPRRASWCMWKSKDCPCRSVLTPTGWNGRKLFVAMRAFCWIPIPMKPRSPFKSTRQQLTRFCCVIPSESTSPRFRQARWSALRLPPNPNHQKNNEAPHEKNTVFICALALYCTPAFAATPVPEGWPPALEASPTGNSTPASSATWKLQDIR